MANKPRQKFYQNNKNLPTGEAQFEWTQEMVEELTSCTTDIFNFAEKYFHIVTLDDGKRPIKLYPAQRRVLKSLVKHRRVCLLASRQIGKALALDTPIPTPNGWTTMGELKVGNEVYGRNGRPCRVTHAWEVRNDRPCYKVTFSNGDTIVADEEHNWFTQTYAERQRGTNGSIKTTKQIIDSEGIEGMNHRIPMSSPIQGTGAALCMLDPCYQLENARVSEAGWVTVMDVQPIDSVPVRCITVDSDDHLFLCGKSMIVTSNTTLMTIYALWTVCFQESKRVLILANKEKTAIQIFDRVRMAYEMLPNWLKPGVDGEYGKTGFKLVNGSSIAVSSTSASSVRGDRANVLILDELAFVPPQVIEEFWESVMPVISSSSKSQIFVVSTPNGTQNRFYELYKKAETGEGSWHAERVDWYEVPGRTERWKKMMIDDLGSVERFDQEFGNQFVEVGQSPFAKQVFDDLRDMKTRPKYAFTDTLIGFEPQPESDEYTTYRIWKTAEAGHTYAIGVDVGEGVGRAASVAAVIDITDLTSIELVAMYHNRRIQPVQFATKLLKIAQHYGNPNMLVERNNCGGQVIDSLSNIHHYTRLVNYSPSNPNQKYYDRLGIYSHTNAKYKGVTNMRYWFDHLRAMRIYDISTVQEFETFIRQPNGTWSHQDGEHIYDDRVMAIIWALFILEKEIAEKYLYVIEYDNTGKPSRVEDPYSETYDIDPMQMSTRNKVFTGSATPPVSMIGRKGFNPYHRDDDMQDLLAQGWKVVNQQFDGSTPVLIL